MSVINLELANLEALDKKNAGYLIKSQEWNQLVAALIKIRDALIENSNGLTNLSNRVDKLEQRVYKVTLQTDQLNYLNGQLATITARVTDLNDNPLTLPTDQAQWPWIDFMTSWGDLRAQSGFISARNLSEAGEDSLSVRVNAEGIAQVLLRSQHAQGFTPIDDEGMKLFLDSPIKENMLLRDVLIQSNTSNPLLESNLHAGFNNIVTKYDNESTASPGILTKYIDRYYLWEYTNPGKLAAGLIDNGWNDYRATVICFARADRNPTTASESLGVNSIQVTFRDWIKPWIRFYLDRDRLKASIDKYIQVIKDKIKPDFIFAEAIADIVNNIIDENNNFKGLVGRVRNDLAYAEAFKQIDNEQIRTTLTQGMELHQALSNNILKANGTLNDSFIGLRSTAQIANTGIKTTNIENKIVNLDSKVNVGGEIRDSIVGIQTQLGGLNAIVDKSQFAETVAKLNIEIEEINNKLKTPS
jgi:hypothetical protein